MAWFAGIGPVLATTGSYTAVACFVARLPNAIGAWVALAAGRYETLADGRAGASRQGFVDDPHERVEVPEVLRPWLCRPLELLQ